MLPGRAAAEPISFRGVNWAMSEADQVAALEKQDLTCIREAGWGKIGLFFPTSATLIGLRPRIICIQGTNNQGAVEQLRASFQEWTKICDVPNKEGYLSLECISFKKFNNLKDSLERVRFTDDDEIVFNCNLVSTCGFDVVLVVRQLQSKIIEKDFYVPTGKSNTACADGPDGDAICVNSYRNDIWLMKKPFGQNMKFRFFSLSQRAMESPIKNMNS
jgi:hypothetical protein